MRVDRVAITQASFVTAIKEGRKYFEIFENPTSTELKDLKKKCRKNAVRFILVPKTETIYIFNAELLHCFVMKYLKLENYFLLGYGVLTENLKIEMHHIDNSVYDLSAIWLTKWFKPK